MVNVLKRIIAFAAMACLCVGVSRAQYDPNFAHYWAMEPSYNPAAVGKEQKLNMVGAYAMSMAGFENAPSTMYAAVDMPFRFLNVTHGVGAQFINDAIGLFSHKRFALQYALKLRLLGGTISAGVNLGLLSESFDGSSVDTETESDPAFPTSDATGTGFDLGAGLYYMHRRWWAGFSVTHVTSPTVDIGDEQSFDIAATYYLTGGYNIKLRNPFFTIHPSVLARTDWTNYRVDVTARVNYTHEKKVMYAGLSYSPTNSVTLMVGGDFHGVNIGYSYEMYTSAISIGNGSHELFLGYQMDIDLGKKGRNKHKSVRIL